MGGAWAAWSIHSVITGRSAVPLRRRLLAMRLWRQHSGSMERAAQQCVEADERRMGSRGGGRSLTQR